MDRGRTVVLVGATVLAFAGSAVAVAALVSDHTSAPPAAVTASAADGDTRSAQEKAESTFIGTTAVHLCNVGATVYDDASALTTAYRAVPTYPGLSAAQVTAFRHRLVTDRAFALRLATELENTCHPTGR